MKWSAPFIPVLLVTMLGTSTAYAVEYKSIGNNPAVLYNAPTEKGRKVFVAPRGMPVEVVLTQTGWSKVRDVAGDLAWVEAKALSSKRNVVVTAANLKLHTAADDASAVVATADKGVLLELVAPPAAGWVKLKHRDGQTGFAKSSEVWGE